MRAKLNEWLDIERVVLDDWYVERTNDEVFLCR